MKKIIKVQIGYYDFSFEDLKEAEEFADKAAKTRENDCRVSIDVSYIDKEEEDEV